MKLTNNVAPQDIKTKDGFRNTIHQNSEKETISRNIVIISRDNGKWFPFNFEDYKNGCGHNVTVEELRTIEDLAAGGYLSEKDGKYEITDMFLNAIREYWTVKN